MNANTRLPYSDRFLGILSPTKPSSAAVGGVGIGVGVGELTESEILWTTTESSRDSPTQPRRKLGFRPPEKSGILAALGGEDGSQPRPRAIPIPRPHGSGNRVVSEVSQSAPSQRKFQNSAPVKVPPASRMSRRFSEFDEKEFEEEKEEGEEMLPPHEIVAMKLKKTSSVLEGVGRTLKGRDLRQVRDAVWRQSGFID